MQIPYELILGWRYTRAGRSTRRNGFISFISGVSMLGIALGVGALIIVLSVMNGFQKEVRDRMLGVVSHIEIYAQGGAALPDLNRTLAEVRANPAVIGAAPFIAAQALLARGDDMKGAMVRGIDPALEPSVTDLAGELKNTVLKRLVSGGFGVVLGVDLARSLGVREGDVITLIAPSGQVTPAGVVPRLKQMTVVGTFSSGHYEYDSALVMLHQDDAARIFRLEGPTGVRLKIRDLHQARAVADQLATSLSGDLLIRDWTRQNRTWFAAVQVEKRMMFIILTLDRGGGRVQPGQHAGHDRDRQARRHRHPAHPGRQPGQHHGHLRGAGRDGRCDRHAGRPFAGPGRGLQHRRHRAGAGEPAARQLPAQGHLPDQPHAQRSAAQRHPAGGRHLAGAGLPGHDLPQLARQPREPRRGTAL
jgi:hypothetical protein